MALAIPGIYDRISRFKHAPLDHTRPSIRILKVLPDLSREGFIQCIIAQGTIADDYTCLSYTWGDEDTACPILVDVQLFFVRQNLHNFLHVVRKKYPSRPFWIDAVCIDQNSIAERNHQVAQMGAIYAAAAHIMIWLGNSSKIADFFRTWNDRPQHESKISWYIRAEDQLKRVEAGWVELANHAYWTRAWITQEIANSRVLSMLADVVEVKDLQGIPRIPWFAAVKFDERFLVQMNIARHHHTILRKSLSYLLERLPHQECHNPRDQIYALLGLAAEGAAMRVDYGSSDLGFILTLFKGCRELACLCGLKMLSNVLGNLEEADARLPLEAYFVKLTLPLSSKWTVWHRTADDDCPLRDRPDTVLVFQMHKICYGQPLNLVLEVVDFGDEGERQQIYRFARMDNPDCNVNSTQKIWPFHHCHCQDDLQWWQRSIAPSSQRMHYDYNTRSWQPDIGVRGYAKLCWSYDTCAKRIVSDWFRAELDTIDASEGSLYTLRIPMAIFLSYAQQSRVLADLIPRYVPKRIEPGPWRSRLNKMARQPCDRARNGLGAFVMIEKDQDS